MTQAASAKFCTKCHAEIGADHEVCPYDGSDLAEQSSDPLIGQVFAGKYEVQSVLGRGGMSVVYKARHLFMKRDVAIKVLHTHLTSDANAIERFKQEAEAASSLNHPNIITVYDFGISREGQAYLIMECFSGPTLSDVLEKDKRISVTRGVHLLRQLCKGLDHAHRNGVVHRDLKPSNLCLTQDENGVELLKIVDFGIAKMVPQDGQKRQQLTQQGQIFGSPLFMSPEQCQGKTLDARSDLYSVGCLAYEALTGVPPLLGDTAFDTMTMHIGEKPRPLKRVAPDIEITTELETPIMQCLEKDPANRPQTAAQLLADLPPDQLVPADKWIPSWYGSLRHNMAARMAVNSLITTVAIVIPLLVFYFKWPGPETDRGTMHERTEWALRMWLAERGSEGKSYQFAQNMLDSAEALARKFGDNHSRLLATLNQQSRLGMEAGNFDYAEEANHEVIDVLDARARDAAEVELKALNDLAGLATDPERARKGIQFAEARVGRIEYTARELTSRQMPQLAEKLLRRALEVDSSLLRSDPAAVHKKLERRIAELNSLLADCLIQQQRPSGQIRELLAASHSMFEKIEGAGSADAVRSLLKLGQYDRDQSKYVEAKKELEQTLALAKDNANIGSDLLKACQDSYADYLEQISRLSAEDKALFEKKK